MNAKPEHSGERRTPLRVQFTLWNYWVRPRKEQYADGSTATLFFGIGRLTWRR